MTGDIKKENIGISTRIEFLRKSRIDGKEPKLISYLAETEDEFNTKIALLTPEDREIAIEFRQIKMKKLENQALKEVANLINLVDNRTPVDTILSEAGPSLEIIKSLLSQRGLKELIN